MFLPYNTLCQASCFRLYPTLTLFGQWAHWSYISQPVTSKMKAHIYRLKPKPSLQPPQGCSRPLPTFGTVCYSPHLLRALPLCQWDPFTPQGLCTSCSPSFTFLLPAWVTHTYLLRKPFFVLPTQDCSAPHLLPQVRRVGSTLPFTRRLVRSLSSCAGKRGTLGSAPLRLSILNHGQISFEQMIFVYLSV